MAEYITRNKYRNMKGDRRMDSLLTVEQLQLQKDLREVVKSIPREYVLDVHADKIKYPREFLKAVGAKNLYGIRVPKKYGGRAMGWKEQLIVSEELGALGLMFGCAAGVSGDVVPEALFNFATEKQKMKYLVPLCKGEIFAAECLTEPRGGSDFFGSTTYATRDGDDFILNGQKRFIVGGEGADIFLVYAKTNPEGGAQNSMTVFLVERAFGVETKYIYGLMGSHGGGTARVVFDNVRVPKENVIGEVNGAFPIFYQMMVPERFGTAALTLGAARPALEIATDYTTKRKAFGKTINKFQGVSFKIADAIMKMDATRGFQHVVAQILDKEIAETGLNSDHTRRLVSEVKKYTSDEMWDVVNISMQVMGGIGYTDVYPIERILRDLRLGTIWVGSNEIMQLIIQHEWYKERKEELAKGTDKREVILDTPGAFDEGEKIYE